jgi:RNA polymerase sigma-70 factor (ECF subfamily)
MSSRAEAEDVMQESYLQAFLNLGQLRDSARFDGWLRSIVIGTAHKRTRRLRLWKRASRDGTELDHLETTDASPEVRAELSRAMALVGGLPSELRMPYVLRYVEGMTVPEIAQATSWSERTVKRRIQAALSKLEKRGGPDGSR